MAIHHGLHLMGLWALAVLQPTLDVLSQGPDLFIQRNSLGFRVEDRGADGSKLTATTHEAFPGTIGQLSAPIPSQVKWAKRPFLVTSLSLIAAALCLYAPGSSA